MYNRVIGSLCAGMIAAGLIFGGSQDVFAAETEESRVETETTTAESETETLKQTEPSGTETTETESIPVVETESESKAETESEIEETVEEEGLRENSFRFSNGEWIHSDQRYFAGDFVPWSRFEGEWINSLGKPMPGFVEKGIDVSYIQKRIDWEKVMDSDVSFAIIRCGYGDDLVSQDDSWWKINADRCTELGIPFGTYIYSYATTIEEAKSEAEHVLRLVKGYDMELPIYYDLEDEGTVGKLSNKEIAELAETFCTTISDAGYRVGIYANLNWFRDKLTDPRFEQWDHWVAQYNYQCDYEGDYTLWQCTSVGVVDGIDHEVDLNFSTYPILNEEDREVIVWDFVKRLYTLVLEREPDADGIQNWQQLLMTQEKNGCEVAGGFFFSDEMLERELSDEAYLDVLYRTCLDREADEDGKAFWLSYMQSGLSREFIVRGFVESKEFTRICSKAGITRGEMELKNICDQYPEMTRFIYRNYTEFLNRVPEAEGIEAWVTRLVNAEKTPKEVAYGFVCSDELEAQQLSDEAFIKTMYKGFFDRGADSEGMKVWTKYLKDGHTREEIFEGFAESDEFKRLVAKFGL